MKLYFFTECQVPRNAHKCETGSPCSSADNEAGGCSEADAGRQRHDPSQMRDADSSSLFTSPAVSISFSEVRRDAFDGPGMSHTKSHSSSRTSVFVWIAAIGSDGKLPGLFGSTGRTAVQSVGQKLKKGNITK